MAVASIARSTVKRHWLTLVLSALFLPFIGSTVSLAVTRKRLAASLEGDNASARSASS